MHFCIHVHYCHKQIPTVLIDHFPHIVCKIIHFTYTVTFELLCLVHSSQMSSSPVTVPSAGDSFYTVTVTASGVCQSEPVCPSMANDFGTPTNQSKTLNVIIGIITSW